MIVNDKEESSHIFLIHNKKKSDDSREKKLELNY